MYPRLLPLTEYTKSTLKVGMAVAMILEEIIIGLVRQRGKTPAGLLNAKALHSGLPCE